MIGRLLALTALVMFAGIAIACGGSSSPATSASASAAPSASTATPSLASPLATSVAGNPTAAVATPVAQSSPTAHPLSTPMPIGTPPPTTAKEITVKIVDFAFDPPTITIAPGTTVTWVNDGATIHTATSKTGVWDSKILNPGDKYHYTFTTAGDFAYWCSVHPDMLGEVIVK